MKRNHPEYKTDASDSDVELEMKMETLINELSSSRKTSSSTKAKSEKKPPKSTADEYFEEIVDMLNHDEDSIPETKPYEFYIEDDTDFFNQILALIPKDQIPGATHKDKLRTTIERITEINVLEQELDNLWKKNAEEKYKRDSLDLSSKEYIQKKLKERKNPYAQAARDDLRIASHLESIQHLVRQMSILSPSRRLFTKIIINKKLDNYDKVQSVVEMARKICAARKAKQPGFFLLRINQNTYRIQDTLANIDINADAPAPLPFLPKM